MSQYKKVTTCCGSTIKEGKTCDCPCQLIIALFNLLYRVDAGVTRVLYNGRPVGLHGAVDYEDGGTATVKFTANGIEQTIIVDSANDNVMYSFENVTKIEVTCVGDTCVGSVGVNGMTEPCR
ncbi:hypothetical protein V1503_06115 [Bacillus sp. SCS-151]|uniref:hypothetical protein n=1 Tax=Nanhaiella sioensis TaxID=3115293 RepID=UPI00397E215F